MSYYSSNWTTDDSLGTTDEPRDESDQKVLEVAYNVLVALQIFLMMLSMGCGVGLSDLKALLKTPAGVIIGLVCQLALMPLLAFITAHALDLDDAHAIGLVVVSACPAGAPATLFTLVSGGDVTLCVCLTVFSTVLALGTMPLNKLLYVRSWSDTPVVIPYLNIAIAIVCTWVPTLIGIAIRYKYENPAEKIKKIGGISAFVVLLISAIVQQQLYKGLFDLEWTEWFAGLTLAFLGWVVGFGFAALFCLDVKQRRAIAYGTSFVNGPLALALISVTYDGDRDRITELILFPMLYIICMIIDNLVLSIAHMVYIKHDQGDLICQRKCKCCKNYSLDDDKNLSNSENKKVSQVSAGKIQPNDEKMKSQQEGDLKVKPEDHQEKNHSMTLQDTTQAGV